jgi:hypothetical protein|uniref:Uncharacterized protein n=1 Tax=Myoviridae sp. ctshb19 TaxID=2825194 RepID=A0A8S5UGP3_9CAUD|nr:MAG TPA: hypothetical protein [Myoviridae sp. ctshb19]
MDRYFFQRQIEGGYELVAEVSVSRLSLCIRDLERDGYHGAASVLRELREDAKARAGGIWHRKKPGEDRPRGPLCLDVDSARVLGPGLGATRNTRETLHALLTPGTSRDYGAHRVGLFLHKGRKPLGTTLKGVECCHACKRPL